MSTITKPDPENVNSESVCIKNVNPDFNFHFRIFDPKIKEF